MPVPHNQEAQGPAGSLRTHWHRMHFLLSNIFSGIIGYHRFILMRRQGAAGSIRMKNDHIAQFHKQHKKLLKKRQASLFSLLSGYRA
jgi:hypothetical protein